MRVIRFAEVRSKVGLSRTTIWRLEQDGRFPRRRQLSAGAVGWIAEEVEEWLQNRPSTRAATDLARGIR